MSNLQLFTEPGGDGGGSREGDGAGAGGNPGNSGNTTMSFDEFLALEGNQSEFDRRVQKAVNTAVTNAQTKCGVSIYESAKGLGESLRLVKLPVLQIGRLIGYGSWDILQRISNVR